MKGRVSLAMLGGQTSQVSALKPRVRTRATAAFRQLFLTSPLTPITIFPRPPTQFPLFWSPGHEGTPRLCMRQEKRPWTAFRLTAAFPPPSTSTAILAYQQRHFLSFWPLGSGLGSKVLCPMHKACLLSPFKGQRTYHKSLILVPCHCTPMATELGSMVLLLAHRSARRGRGSNGGDIQLEKLGNLLTAPTRPAKKRFAPSDGLSLPDNLLAPVQKKRQKNKKVCTSLSILQRQFTNHHQASLLPPMAPQPCQQSPALLNIDPRFGFTPPQPSSTPLFHVPSPEAPAQPSLTLSPHVNIIRSRSPAHPPCTPALPSDTGSHHSQNPTDPESDGSNTDTTQDEPDIDERSDDEDKRAAHRFLLASPTATDVPTNSPLTILPYNHQGFSVSRNTDPLCLLTPVSP